MAKDTTYDYAVPEIPYPSGIERNVERVLAPIIESLNTWANRKGDANKRVVTVGELADLVLSSVEVNAVVSGTDHGTLSGKGDDDHTQYLLVDGTRAMSGNLDLNGNQLIIDTDGDSYLVETSDDVVALYLAGASKYSFGGSAFTVASGIATTLNDDLTVTGDTVLADLRLSDTAWDDFVVPAASIRLGGANPADEVAYKSGMVLSFDNSSDEYVYFVIQLPHRYKEGTDVKLHIHWVTPVAGSAGGAENVKWDLTYSASSPTNTIGSGEQFPAASTGTLTVDVQNALVDEHIVSTIATMTGTNFKISECIICSLKRDTTVANNYGNEAYVVSIDAHVEVDTMGSDDEWTK